MGLARFSCSQCRVWKRLDTRFGARLAERGLSLQSEFADELVGEADGFGQSIFERAAEGDSNRISQQAFVTDRDEDGFHVCACPNDGPDNFQVGISYPVRRAGGGAFLVFQQTVGPFLRWRVVEESGESAFCAAYGRVVEEQTQMCCEAESAGMGDALAVDNEYIRLVFEFFDGGNADGCFAK